MRGLHQNFDEFQRLPFGNRLHQEKEQNRKIDTSTKVNLGNLANTFKLESRTRCVPKHVLVIIKHKL